MAYTSYIPSTDAGLSSWLTNFDGLTSVNYAAYGLTSGEATAITSVTATYVSALTAATDPGTRTPVTVAAKDAAKFAALGTVRPLAIKIRNNPGVSDETKVLLGLTVPSVIPTPVPTPTTFPLLSVLNGTPHQHLIQSRDSDTPTSKKKPFGAIQMQLYCAIGTSVAPSPAGAVFFGVSTKSPFRVTHSSEDAGKIATYFGRWITRTGLVGPWSDGASMVIT